MRKAPWLHLEKFRIDGPRNRPFGRFVMRHTATQTDLVVVASDGRLPHEDGTLPLWEHVSVSARKRCPNWQEMETVCRLFWEPEECVMQLHPPRSEWVNNHPFCLHLWRPKDPATPIPRPPQIMVGVPGLPPEVVREIAEGKISIDDAAAALALGAGR